MAIKNKPRKNIPIDPRPNFPQPNMPQMSVDDWLNNRTDPLGKSGMDWLKSISDKIPTGGGVLPSGGSTGKKGSASTSPNDMDDSWSSILGHNAGDDGFLQWLASQGFGGSSDPGDAWAKDFNNFIMQKMVEYGQLKEDRAYNRSLQLDERTYNSPTNQLARLMGAGISRDAAIQLLGGAGGSGGSGVPYSQPFGSGDATAPSQSKLNDVQAGTSIANSIFDGASALLSLTSFGLSVPQSLSQINMQRNASFMSDQQRQAYEAASGAFQIINAAGVPNSSEVFGSIGSTLATLQSLAESGNMAASSFLQNGRGQLLQQTAPFSSPMLSKIYQDERSAGDYALDFDTALGLMRSETELNKINRDKIEFHDIPVIDQELENLRETQEYIKASSNLATASAKYQIELAKSEPYRRKKYVAEAARDRAQAASLRESARALKLENDATSYLLSSHTSTGKSGLQLLTDAKLNELLNTCDELKYARTTGEYKRKIDKLLADYDMSISLYELQKMYNDGTLEYLKSHGDESGVNLSAENLQNMLYLCRALEDNGVFDYVRTQSHAENAGFESTSLSTSSNVYGLGTSSSVTSSKSRSSDAANILNTKKKRK